MKNGRGALNKNGLKEYEENIIDEKTKPEQIAIIGNQYFKLEKQKQILQIDEITTCLTMSNVPPYKSLQ